MPVPGQYPANPSRETPRTIAVEELKPVPCKKCGEVKRRAISWIEHRVHRLNPGIKGKMEREVWFCLSCSTQVDDDGAAVAPENPNYLKPEDLHKMFEDLA